MAKHHVAFLNIDNEHSSYAECMKIMDDILSNVFLPTNIKNLNKIKISINQYESKDIIPNKLEEPLDGKDISSSITPIPYSEFQKYSTSILNQIHFHIRIY